MGLPCSRLGEDLEAEAESESVSKRGILRRGDADPLSITVDRTALNPAEVCGSVNSAKTLVIAGLKKVMATDDDIGQIRRDMIRLDNTHFANLAH